MEGHQLTFFVPEEQTHEGLPVAEWLTREAQALGIGGVIRVPPGDGSAQLGRLFAVRFSGLTKEPQMLTMAVTVAELQGLPGKLRKEKLSVFYTFTQFDFGISYRS